MPVHSLPANLLFASSMAIPAKDAAVLLKAPTYIDAESNVWLVGSRSVVVEGRGSNQLLLKSKKQWSDQWHDEAKRMSRRKEQYTQGRLRK